jgi:hydroxyacylglutathione hydrolase
MIECEPIPAFRDNYIWALHAGRAVAFVDPGDAGPILAWLGDRRLTPVAILVSHHHADHTGGVAELTRRWPMPVYGPAEAGPLVDHPLADGEVCHLPELAAAFQVLAVPGHTLGHLAYLGHGYLFCGDALFSCGCGRVFEGSPAMMHASLQRLAALPADTQVCCAHEYTLANLAFARHVDPDNPHLDAWQEAALALRRAGRPTLPVSLGEERERNPFLRCADPAFRRQLETRLGLSLPDGVAAFAELRAAKNNF